MDNYRLFFLINGSECSSADLRAKTFAQRFSPNWHIHFKYRSNPKWKGIFQFIQSVSKLCPDIVYVMDTAYTGVLAGYIAKKLLGCKLIVDTGDVAYKLAKSKGTYSNSQLKLINWIEQLAIQNSDCLIVRGSYHKTWLEKQGFNHVKFVPDGVDTASITEFDATTIKHQMGLEDYLVVGLIGTMNWSDRYRMCYGWDVVEAMGLLKDAPVKALLVGDGGGRVILEQRAEELGVRGRIVFAGQVPYAELPRYLSAMDVCVSTQSNDLVGQVRTTGKLPLYLAYGKYVIATDVGEASRVLPGVGWLLPYVGVRDDDHPARLADHLRGLLAEPQRLSISEKARQVAKEQFDYTLLAHRVEAICRKLVNP
jgi:glycosyltransferase involved in cell wall biosynthesis